MSQIKVGHFEQDGSAVYVPCGFIPSYLMFIDYDPATPDTDIVLYHWFSAMEDDMDANDQEGFSVTEGATAALADDGGFAAYDSESAAPTIADWAASTSYTARTATANGSFVRPTTSGAIDSGEDADRSLIFECVTAGTSGSTEPVWNPAVGENSPSDNGVVWQCVPEATYRKGYQGFSVAGDLLTDGQEAFFLAILADDDIDFGDSADWVDGIADIGQSD